MYYEQLLSNSSAQRSLRVEKIKGSLLDYLRQLEEILGDPIISAPEIDWERVHGVIGRTLPADYLHVYRRYGGLIATDEFFEVIAHMVFVERIDEEVISAGIDSFRFLGESSPEWLFYVDGERQKRSSSFIFNSTPFSVTLIGDTENGDSILLFYDEEISDWSIIVASGTVWCQFRMSFSEFLIKAMNRNLPYEAFPDDWPGEGVRLAQYDDASGGPA